MKRLLFVILAISLLISVSALAEGQDKIAIATDEKDPQSPVSNRMGQSPFYLLFDENGSFVEAIDNPFKNERKRPEGSMIESLTFDEKGTVTGGVATPSRGERDKIWNTMFRFFAQKGIKVIVAEEFGDEIIKGFKAQGINCVAFNGRAEDAARIVSQSAK